MNEEGEIEGMVDVLKLTYATLDQINSMGTNEGEGPAWQKFWLSMGHETESAMSGEGSHSHTHHTPFSRSAVSPDAPRPGLERGDSVMPHESASHHGDENESPEKLSMVGGATGVEDLPFTFKFKAPSGRVHRLQVTASAGMSEFVSNVTAKLGGELEAVGGEPMVEEGKLGKSGFALSYLDNEGDTVSITTDHDLLEAITLAQKGRRDKVDLFVHDPEKPPLSSTLDPHPGLAANNAPLTPADSAVLKERRRRMIDEGDEQEEERPKKSAGTQAEQVISGVPNELLLPGAIAALAVAIVGVFAISRAGNR